MPRPKSSAIQPGACRHRGRLGALLVEFPGGVQFAVGTGLSDRERENPPPIGSTISFRFQEFTDGGIPRFPVYVGLRSDLPIPSIQQQETPVAEATSGKRRFEFVEGSSDKFWEVERDQQEVRVRFGRNGTQGQTNTKTFPDIEAAEKHVAKLVKGKTGKGYCEVV